MFSLSEQVKSKANLVIGAGFALGLILGVLYSWSVLAKAIVGEWGWSSAQASLPYALALGFFAFTMVPAGRVQDRIGPRLVGMVGSALVGVGLILSSLANDTTTWPIIVGFGAITGIGVGLGYAAATPAAVKWFGQARKGMVTGIVVAGFGLASIYIAPLTTWMIGAVGISNTFLYLGIAFLALGVFFSSFIVNPPADWVPAPVVVKESARPRREVHAVEDRTPGEMMRSATFPLVYLAYGFSAFAGLMIMGHLAKIGEVQTGSALGFLLIALVSIGNAGGRLVAGALFDRIGLAGTLFIAFLGQAATLMIIGSVTTLPVMAIMIVFVGLFYGSLLALFPVITAELYGTKHLGVNYGIVFTAWGLGGVFGSLTAGRIFDATGSYQWAFWTAAILCLLAAGLGYLLVRAINRAHAAA